MVVSETAHARFRADLTGARRDAQISFPKALNFVHFAKADRPCFFFFSENSRERKFPRAFLKHCLTFRAAVDDLEIDISVVV